MLTAYDDHHVLRDADQALRDHMYSCPECLTPVILKHGVYVIAHFAHKVRPPACTMVGESDEHLWMKQTMRDFFGRHATRVEQCLIPGHRADVVLPAQPLVIECQVSSIAIPEWEQRTRDYNHHGYAVLWVWSPTRLGIPTTDQDLTEIDAIGLAHHGVRVAVEILHCHQLAYGRIYVLARTGHLVAVHLDPVRRHTPMGVEYALSATRTLRLLPLAPTSRASRVTTHQSSGIRLAQIELASVWWHDL